MRYRGQTIVELVIALGVIAILAISLVGTNLLTQKTSRSAESEVQATKLVQQGVEEVRIFRDNRGYSLVQTSTTNCFKINKPVVSDPNTWTMLSITCYSGVSTTGDPILVDQITFYRNIRSEAAGADRRKITVEVIWDEPAGRRVVKNETFLALWCQGSVMPGSPCPTP